MEQSSTDKTSPKDGRAEWERPALRRLAAHEAQSGAHNNELADAHPNKS
jgi:hypothetical protein